MTMRLAVVRGNRAVRIILRRATIAAVLAGLAAILLLAVSGWFLVGAAVAGAGGVVAVTAFNYLIPSAAIRGLAIARTIARYGDRLWSHEAALAAIADLRGRLFAGLAGVDSRIAPDLSGGDASARLIGDIEALEDLVVRRPARPASMVAAVCAVALAALAGWRAALVLSLLLAALPWLLTRISTRLTRTASTEAATAMGELRRSFVDYAAARPEIVAYGLGDRVSANLMVQAERLDRARAMLFRGEGAIAGLLMAYAGLATVAVLAVARGPAALMAAAMLAAAASVEAMGGLARTALREARVAESLTRLDVLWSLPGNIRAIVDPLPPRAWIQLGKHVIDVGGRVAITGVSGSGKTRLIEALAGIRQPVHALAVGGIAVEELPATALRSQVALSPQDATLIAGSIADNLRLARPGVTDEDMTAALMVACLDEAVAAMPRGLMTELSEGGGTLSGGERKRLSIARALLAGRPWLLLDEPTEGLDPATEAQLIARLGAWLDRTGAGLVLVSHRPAPLVLARQLLPITDVGRLGNEVIAPVA